MYTGLWRERQFLEYTLAGLSGEDSLVGSLINVIFSSLILFEVGGRNMILISQF